MKTISTILHEMLAFYNGSQLELAKAIDVSPATISRWLRNSSSPRPSVEGQIREMHRLLFPEINPSLVVRESRGDYVLRLFEDEQFLGESVRHVLSDLREALHRRGRLSSRNEALDELSKLLFAHILTPGGISSYSIPGFNEQPASSLVTFVRGAFQNNLPISLGHEMPLTDFQLRLKPQENALAIDVVNAFERLTKNNLALSLTKGYDVLNEIFGVFLADSFSNEKELGQYLTPSVVVNFMVNLAVRGLSPEEFSKLCNPDRCVEVGQILDPSCGVASFLAETVRVLTPEVINRHGKVGLQRWLKNMVSSVLVGIDKSERMMRLALTNLALFGFTAADLHLFDALSRRKIEESVLTKLENRAQLILTNPPFGAEVSGKDLEFYRLTTIWSERPIQKINSELLFLERYVDWLRPGGQCLAIVPDSILTNRGIYEELRSGLASSVEVCSVISLPDVTFAAAGTNTKTSILHFRKLDSRQVKCHTTRFAICQEVGYSVRTKNAQRTRRTIGDGIGELPRILEEFSSSQQSTALSRQVENVANSARWDAKYHISLPIKLEEKLRKPSSSDLFVRDVAILVNDRVDPRRWGNGEFSYIEIGDINGESFSVTGQKVKCVEAPSRARKLVSEGDILFSTVRPERKAVGVVGSELNGAVCSTGIAVLRPFAIHPVVLANLLRSDFVTVQVIRNTLGIAYPSVDEQTLQDILLPVFQQDIKASNQLTEEIIELLELLKNKRELLSSLLSDDINRWKMANQFIYDES